MAALIAVAAALLFGATVPLAKTLLAHLPPVALAGLLYLGCGIGLLAIVAVRRLLGVPIRFARAHVPAFLGSLVSGGIVAPLLFVQGLADTTAGDAALLLNLETVFTVVLARVMLREPFGARRWLGMAFVVGAAVGLGWSAARLSWHVGDLLVACACGGWALDNILTRRVADADALFLAGTKGAVAGLVDLGLAAMVSRPWGAITPVPEALLVGFVGYGLSLVGFIVALRTLGAARTSSYFASAPFFAAVLATASGETPLTLSLGLAFWATAVGVVLLTLSDRRHTGSHRHWHYHGVRRRHHDGPAHAPRLLWGWHCHGHDHG